MTCGVSLSAIRLADVCCPVEFGADHFYPAFSEQTEINNTQHALRLQLRGRTHQRPCRKTHFSATICHSDSQVFQQRWRMWTTHTHTWCGAATIWLNTQLSCWYAGQQGVVMLSVRHSSGSGVIRGDDRHKLNIYCGFLIQPWEKKRSPVITWSFSSSPQHGELQLLLLPRIVSVK